MASAEEYLREWVAELIVENAALRKMQLRPSYARIRFMQGDKVLYDQTCGMMGRREFGIRLDGITGVETSVW